jgi:hypothetical protein
LPLHRGDANNESIFSAPLFSFLLFFACFSGSSVTTCDIRTVSMTSASDAARASPLVDASLDEPGLLTETVDSFDLSDGCPSVVRAL